MYVGVIKWFRRHDTHCQRMICNTAVLGSTHQWSQTNLGVSGSYGENIFCLSPWCSPDALSDLRMFSMNRWLHLLVSDHNCIGLGRPDGDLNTVANRRWLLWQAGFLMVQYSAFTFWVLGVQRSISALNSCQASTSGGGLVACCFGKTTMTHFFTIFYDIFWYISWYICFKLLVWHIFLLSLFINCKKYYKTQHFHSWERPTCNVLQKNMTFSL